MALHTHTPTCPTVQDPSTYIGARKLKGDGGMPSSQFTLLLYMVIPFRCTNMRAWIMEILLAVYLP